MRIDTETLKRARPDIWPSYKAWCQERQFELGYSRDGFFAFVAEAIYENGTPEEINARIERVIGRL